MANKKWIYLFNEIDQAEAYAGSWDGVRGLLGGKGAGLAEMTRIGKTFEPNPENSKIYDELYNRVYLKMYDRLVPLYKEIQDITGYPAND